MKGRTSLFQRTRALLLTLCMVLMLLPVSAMADDEKTVVEDIRIDNVSNGYVRDGDPIVFTGRSAEPDQYELLGEYWFRMEPRPDGDYEATGYATSDPEARYAQGERITAFDSDYIYYYWILVRTTSDSLVFAQDVPVYLNGEMAWPSENPAGVTELMCRPDGIAPDYIPTTVIPSAGVVGATLNFKAGDKPVFTGTSAQPDLYDIVESWIALDENGDWLARISTDTDRNFGDFGAFQDVSSGVTYLYVTEYWLHVEACRQLIGFTPDTTATVNGVSMTAEFYDSTDMGGVVSVTFTADGASYQWPDSSDQPANPEQPSQPTTPEQPSKPESPKTGDTGIMLWITIAMAAAAAMVLTLRKKRA